MTSLRTTLAPMVVAALLATTVLLGGGFGPAASAQAGSDDIDVLTATREEVRQTLRDIDDRVAEHERALERARSEAAEAQEAKERADARVDLARHEVVQARDEVREYSIEAYIRPPAEDAVRLLRMSDAEDAGYAKNVLKIVAEKRYEVVEVLLEKEAIAEREQERAAAASQEATAKADAVQAELADLEGTRAEQADLVRSLDDRLDAALAEAAALADIDRQMAEELAAQELALRQEAPATPIAGDSPNGPEPSAPQGTPARVTTPPAPNTPPAPRPSPTSPPTTRPAPRPTTPPTTRPPAPPSPPGGLVTWADVTNVGGIYVHKSIAGQFRNLLNAASAAGINLGGSGYRDTNRQIQLRRQNCGPTHYDIYQRPSSQCSPPTAIPGRSMHERGLAVDLTHNGALIRSRSNPAFIWLAANAARYGFYNLPSEPWHWSTNGS